GVVIFIEDAADAATAVGHELADEGVRCAARIKAADVKHIVALHAGKGKRGRALQYESAAGSRIEVGLDDQALRGREHGDAEGKRAGAVEMENAAAVRLNRIRAGSGEGDGLRAVEGGVDVLDSASDVAVAVGSERADARKETSGDTVLPAHGKSVLAFEAGIG